MFKEVLTDPIKHSPNDFIYLVHALDCNRISYQEMKDKVKRVRDPNQFYRASMIAHLDAESAKKRIGWYGKVYQVGTFSSVGIIVDPPNDDVVQIAWNCDLGSPGDPKELEKFVQEHKGKIRSPLILLTQTKELYNELILKGDKDTAVKGVFFRLRERIRGRQLREIVSELMQTDVPIIELPPVLINNYDDIKDPKEREIRRTADNLRSISELMQAHLEFYRPELCGGMQSEEIITIGRLEGMSPKRLESILKEISSSTIKRKRNES